MGRVGAGIGGRLWELAATLGLAIRLKSIDEDYGRTENAQDVLAEFPFC